MGYEAEVPTRRVLTDARVVVLLAWSKCRCELASRFGRLTIGTLGAAWDSAIGRDSLPRWSSARPDPPARQLMSRECSVRIEER